MSLPGFRFAIYIALGLYLACLYSPFGWGFTHPPFPLGNLLLSLGFYSAALLCGILALRTIWKSSGKGRSLFLGMGMYLAIWTGAIGSESLLLQHSSSHHQVIQHIKLLGYTLIPLAGIALVKFAVDRQLRLGQKDATSTKNTVQPPS